jgi:hypothetical protein
MSGEISEHTLFQLRHFSEVLFRESGLQVLCGPLVINHL